MFRTIPEAAPRLGMSVAGVRRMIKDGEITAIKGPHDNSPYRIRDEEIEAWLAAHSTRPAPQDVAS